MLIVTHVIAAIVGALLLAALLYVADLRIRARHGLHTEDQVLAALATHDRVEVTIDA
jgi:hypothetical protein